MKAVDISPVVGGGIHGEAGRDGAVGADNDVILAGAAAPVAEVHVAIGILDDTGHGGEHPGGFAVGAGAIAIPAVFSQVQAGGHAHERLHLLKAAHGINHLIAGLIAVDEPVNQGVDFAPIVGTDVAWIFAESAGVGVLPQHGRVVA